MRASLYLIGFAAASLVGAGVAQVGCSSSSGSPAAPVEDAAAEGGGSSSGGGSGSSSGSGGMDAAKPCTPASDASAATIMTGSPSWDCQEVQCKTELTACAADCQCNNDILAALQCLVPDSSVGAQSTCFGPVSGSSNPPDVTALTCLAQHQTMCNAAGMDGTAPADGTAPGDGAAGDGAPADAAGGG
jgi:hypothetical protein